MKTIYCLLLAALLFSQSSFCQPQEDDAFIAFVNTKLPASMNNFSFFEPYGTFLGRQLPHRLDTLSDNSTKASFVRNYKDVDKVEMTFYTTNGEAMYYSAEVSQMKIIFKTKINCDAYLKTLSKPTTDTRWDFGMKDKECKGIQIYKEGDKSIWLKTYTGCGG
jgi:hypothetical protein